MYKTIVSGKVRGVFDALSSGDYQPLLDGLADQSRHVVDGDHALSGTRVGSEDIEKWYQRLFALFPDLKFTVSDVVVKGLPSKTTAIAVWEDSSSTALDMPYKNSGVNVIELSWGKVTAVNIFTNSQYMAEYLEKLAPHHPEASLPPINS